jgi:hypothetical protein
VSSRSSITAETFDVTHSTGEDFSFSTGSGNFRMGRMAMIVGGWRQGR